MDRLSEVEEWMSRRLNKLLKSERRAFLANSRAPTKENAKRLAKLREKSAELWAALETVEAARRQLNEIAGTIRSWEAGGYEHANAVKRISDTFGRPAG